MLRMMREPQTGRPARGTRLLVVLVLAALVGGSAPVLVLVARWLFTLV